MRNVVAATILCTLSISAFADEPSSSGTYQDINKAIAALPSAVPPSRNFPLMPVAAEAKHVNTAAMPTKPGATTVTRPSAVMGVSAARPAPAMPNPANKSKAAKKTKKP